MSDATRLMRTAQDLQVWYQSGTGAPPAYGVWTAHTTARVEQINIRGGKTDSQAAFSLPYARWSDNPGFKYGDKIKIIRGDTDPALRTCLFSGFVVGARRGFSGGDRSSKSWESLVVICRSYRWLLSRTTVLNGQAGRGPDDYDDLGEVTESPRAGEYSLFTGRSCIFNQNGLPNCDPVDVTILGVVYPLFSGRPNATFWTARKMVRYILSLMVINGLHYQILAIPDDPATGMPGLSHADWDYVLVDVNVNGMNCLAALDRIASLIGWSVREDYDLDGVPAYTLFKIGSATASERSETDLIILHELYAPPVGESVAIGVAAGAKMLWQCDLSEDISAIINTPVAQGAMERYEVTVELVRGWKDSEFDPVRSGEAGGYDYSSTFIYNANLGDYTDPNGNEFYRYYHSKGNSFRPNDLRKWVLNESGLYTGGDYDRGAPFDLATVIDEEYIQSGGKRRYGLYRRALLRPISYANQDTDPLPLKVEISYDGGTTWEPFKCGVRTLAGEAGLLITDDNLADIREMTDDDRYVAGTRVDLNYYSALAFDKWNGTELVKLRVTACIEIDQRLNHTTTRSATSASPFSQINLYVFGDRFLYSQRTESSQYSGSALEFDHSAQLAGQVEAVQVANQDASVSGVFTLDRLWIGDETGVPTFAIGDGVSKIAGREVSLALAGAASGFPDIIQINYIPATQRTELVTRDNRYARNMVL